MGEPLISNKSSTASVEANGTFRILHLSDLHFGWHFRSSHWANLKVKASEIKPNLVIVTGDLVNTPWWWTLRQANFALKTFADELKIVTGKEVPIRVIPGNHDTRISGVFPVIWLKWAILGSLLTASIVWWAYSSIEWMVLAALLLPAVVAGVLRLLVSVDMKKYFPEYFNLAPELFADNKIGILPLDSASHGLSWARGYVTSDSLAVAMRNFQKLECDNPAGDKRRLWIATVHHHPLPLPYDDEFEQMMVMDNAGKLLSELSRASVRLVLHGHKHHQHFARISVDPSKVPGAHLAVLSAGTPTDRRANVFWHGFNVIEMNQDARVTIRMYLGPPTGGAFEVDREFDFMPIEQQDKWRHEELAKASGLVCRRLFCLAEVNPFGDARFVREYRGVSTSLSAVTELPGLQKVSASSGLVEAFVARGLCDHGPQVVAKAHFPGRNTVEAGINFSGSGLQKDERPIDFGTEVQANNGIALNRWHYECMYPAKTEYRESVAFRMPEKVAIEELVMHVQFCADIGLPRRLDLRMGLGDPVSSWRIFDQHSLVRINAQCLVQVRVPYPVPGALYQIDWDLMDGDDGKGDETRERGIERALHLRAALDRLHTTTVPLGLREVVTEAEMLARDVLGSGRTKQARPYHVALFTFDNQNKVTRYLVGTHDDDDPRRKAKYPFGLGLPGRAFKAGVACCFRRPVQPPSTLAWGYVRPDGSRISSASEVPENAIVAIPLATNEAKDWPYAVLQLSTDDSSCPLKTTNSPSDPAIAQFSSALRVITDKIEDILQVATTGVQQP